MDQWLKACSRLCESCAAMKALMGKLFLSTSIVLWSGQAAADLSLSCLYTMLSGIHEGMVFCGDKIDANDEAKYVDLRIALKAFINKNAQLDRSKIGFDYDENIKRLLRSRGRAAVCETQDYSVLKKFFLESITAERIAEIRKRLQTPSDPDEGDCP